MNSSEARDQSLPTVVTITPTAVERDSRTFKQAASVARFGYSSLVVEGQASDLGQTILPFTLRGVGIPTPGFLPAGGRPERCGGWRGEIQDLVTALARELGVLNENLLTCDCREPRYEDSAAIFRCNNLRFAGR